MYIGLHGRYQLFLLDFNGTRIIFSTDFRKISNLMKIRPVGAELFHADGRTDMTKLIVACGNFENASKHLTKFRRLRVSIFGWNVERWWAR